MTIDSFATLLDAAKGRPEPQLFLLTFAAFEAEPQQHAAPGQPPRMALAPLGCVDRRAPELAGFDDLAAEARQALGGARWDVLLVSTLSACAGQWPDERQAGSALRAMVNAIKLGQMNGMLAFDRDGELLRWAA